MTAFYEFLKAESVKASGFDAFAYQVSEANNHNLTQSQVAAFQSADSMRIGQQILLEQNDLPHDAAISISIAVTVTVTLDSPV